MYEGKNQKFIYIYINGMVVGHSWQGGGHHDIFGYILVDWHIYRQNHITGIRHEHMAPERGTNPITGRTDKIRTIGKTYSIGPKKQSRLH